MQVKKKEHLFTGVPKEREVMSMERSILFNSSYACTDQAANMANPTMSILANILYCKIIRKSILRSVEMRIYTRENFDYEEYREKLKQWFKGNESVDFYKALIHDLVEQDKKLAAFEDAEEQGRLVILPCKVGDTAYKIEDGCGALSCRDCSADGNCDVQGLHIQEHKTNELFWGLCRDMLNITVFLTREEAESALSQTERQGEQ